MANANIVHSGYGFRCTATENTLPLTLGLDGSAVLERVGGIPEGWLVDALDQLFIAAPALTGVTLPGPPGRMNRRRRRCLRLPAEIIWRAKRSGSYPCGCRENGPRTTAACSSMKAVSFTSRCALTARKVKSIAVTTRRLNAS